MARDQDAGGEPSTGSAELFTLPGAGGGIEVGVWEMGVGAMYDVEVDEVFIVVQGVADVEVLDPSGLVSETVALRPGVVCRLHGRERGREQGGQRTGPHRTREADAPRHQEQTQGGAGQQDDHGTGPAAGSWG